MSDGVRFFVYAVCGGSVMFVGLAVGYWLGYRARSVEIIRDLWLEDEHE